MVRSTRSPRLRVLVSSSVLAASLLACGGEGEEKAGQAPAASAAKPAPAAPEAAGTEPAEPAEPAQAAVPEVELPGDVPRYPGSKFRDSGVGDELGLSATLESPDDVQTIAHYYAVELRRNDWVVQEAPSEEGLAVFADKGSRSLTVMVSPLPTGSEIGLLVVDMQ